MLKAFMNIMSPDEFQSWCSKHNFVINSTNKAVMGNFEVGERLVIPSVVLKLFWKYDFQKYGVLITTSRRTNEINCLHGLVTHVSDLRNACEVLIGKSQIKWQFRETWAWKFKGKLAWSQHFGMPKALNIPWLSEWLASSHGIPLAQCWRCC
jgi:hypothetical protein